MAWYSDTLNRGRFGDPVRTLGWIQTAKSVSQHGTTVRSMRLTLEKRRGMQRWPSRECRMCSSPTWAFITTTSGGGTRHFKSNLDYFFNTMLRNFTGRLILRSYTGKSDVTSGISKHNNGRNQWYNAMAYAAKPPSAEYFDMKQLSRRRDKTAFTIVFFTTTQRTAIQSAPRRTTPYCQRSPAASP